jgi:hypothetical protein
MNKEMIALWAGILGFLGGLLSFAAGLQLNRTGLRQLLRIWMVSKRLQHALRESNRKEVLIYERLLQVMKLYSPNFIHQATATTYFVELNSEDSFEILARRLGTRPQLSLGIKDILISALKQLAPTLNGSPDDA